jgi:hypothetical protein
MHGQKEGRFAHKGGEGDADLDGGDAVWALVPVSLFRLFPPCGRQNAKNEENGRIGLVKQKKERQKRSKYRFINIHDSRGATRTMSRQL